MFIKLRAYIEFKIEHFLRQIDSLKIVFMIIDMLPQRKHDVWADLDEELENLEVIEINGNKRTKT